MIDRDGDKLATVLGHEVAHVLARHSAEGVGLRLLLSGVAWVGCSFLQLFTSNAARTIRYVPLCQLNCRTAAFRSFRSVSR
jgi:Zn-dependent protease with chaperone function